MLTWKASGVWWVELCSSKRYLQVLTPWRLSSVHVSVFGDKIFVDVIKLRGGSYWMMVGPYPITSVYKEKSIHRHTGRTLWEDRGRDCSDTTNQGMSGDARSWKTRKDPSLLPSEGVWHCLHLDSGFLASWTVRQWSYLLHRGLSKLIKRSKRTSLWPKWKIILLISKQNLK